MPDGLNTKERERWSGARPCRAVLRPLVFKSSDKSGILNRLARLRLHERSF